MRGAWVVILFMLIVGCKDKRANAPQARATRPSATNPSMTESQKVDYLIDAIEKLDGATFIRNDVEYSAANAAALMRYRWNRDKDKLKSAEEFVEKLATKSSTTGKPYVIRMKDGTQVPSGEFLLKKLREEAR